MSGAAPALARLWVGNLDCEVEWAGGPPLPAAVVTRLALLATTLRVFCAPEDGGGGGDAASDDAGDARRDGEDALWLPAPVAAGALAGPGPRPRLVAGVVPAAIRTRAWGASARVASPAEVAVARAVNDRRFAAALAADRGVALPGACVITRVDALAAHLAAGGAGASPTGTWVAKAALTAAGRDRVRRRGDVLDPPTATRLARLLAVHGALVFEPWMARTLDVGQGGEVGAGGAIALHPPHRGLVDDAGVVRGIVIDDGAALEPGERALLAATARAAGLALAAAGYRGSFVIDGFVHERDGRRQLHPMCELNARLTFGLVARAWAARLGTPLTLGLGGPPPPGAHALVHDRDGTAAAWVLPTPTRAQDRGKSPR